MSHHHTLKFSYNKIISSLSIKSLFLSFLKAIFCEHVLAENQQFDVATQKEGFIGAAQLVIFFSFNLDLVAFSIAFLT